MADTIHVIVSDADPARRPNNPHYARIEAAPDRAALDALDYELAEHGYAPDGQLRTRIAARRAALLASAHEEG